MKTKKVVKIILACIVLVVVAMITVQVTYIGGEKMSDGVYEIEGNNEYPNAQIIVKNGTIQFCNIDLNAIYREKQLEEYNNIVKMRPSMAFSEDKFSEFSDLNANFVDKPYKINYQKEMLGKEGTFTYAFSLYPGEMVFGLGIDYDALLKEIHICNDIEQLTFKK